MNTPSSSDLSPARELEALADQHYAAGDFTRKHETYFEAYAGIFAGRRDQPLRILELGVHSGASLLIWRDYLPNATVVGLDIEPEPLGYLILGVQRVSRAVSRVCSMSFLDGQEYPLF